jgi:hypothetical protein
MVRLVVRSRLGHRDIVTAKIAQVQALVVRDGLGGDGVKKQILRSARDDNAGIFWCKLDSRAFFLAKLREGFALFGQARQQRSRLPDLAVLAVEFRDARVNLF